jgi:hypothetical protein
MSDYRVTDEQEWLKKHRAHGEITQGASDIILPGLGDLSTLFCSCGAKRLTRGNYTLYIFDEVSEVPEQAWDLMEDRADVAGSNGSRSTVSPKMGGLHRVDKARGGSDPYRRHRSYSRRNVVPRELGSRQGRQERGSWRRRNK